VSARETRSLGEQSSDSTASSSSLVGWITPLATSIRGKRSVDERKVVMSAKRQQTMAKMARERAVKERRARKLEKKQAAAAERRAQANDSTPSAPAADDGA
jgi:hypothetical protein